MARFHVSRDIQEDGLPLSGGTLTGNLLFSATNTYDIGTSSTTLAPRTVYSGTSFVTAAAGAVSFAGRSQMLSAANGTVTLTNAAGTGFTALHLGGTTSSFPSFRLSGANLELKLADNSGYTGFTAGTLTSTGNVLAASGAIIGWNTKSLMVTSVDGNIRLTNNAGTDFTMLQLGGTTSSYPALKRNGSQLHATLADDSGWAHIVGERLTLSDSDVTAGTMSQGNSGRVILSEGWVRHSWTNAMITDLGAVTSGDIAVCTLPAGYRVTDCIIQILTAETALTSCTMSVGITGATYVDYVLAGSIKAAANTLYGHTTATTGNSLNGTTSTFSYPSVTGTTVVNAHIVSGVENLSTAVGSTGYVFLRVGKMTNLA